MTGTSEGGYSRYALQDPINSRMMSNVMTLGGVGNFSATDLQGASRQNCIGPSKCQPN